MNCWTFLVFILCLNLNCVCGDDTDDAEGGKRGEAYTEAPHEQDDTEKQKAVNGNEEKKNQDNVIPTKKPQLPKFTSTESNVTEYEGKALTLLKCEFDGTVTQVIWTKNGVPIGAFPESDSLQNIFNYNKNKYFLNEKFGFSLEIYDLTPEDSGQYVCSDTVSKVHGTHYLTVIACDAKCKGCDGSKDSCTECSSGYTWNEKNTDCVACDAKCKGCDDKKDSCTDCSSGYTWNKKRTDCVDICLGVECPQNAICEHDKEDADKTLCTCKDEYKYDVNTTECVKVNEPGPTTDTAEDQEEIPDEEVDDEANEESTGHQGPNKRKKIKHVEAKGSFFDRYFWWFVAIVCILPVLYLLFSYRRKIIECVSPTSSKTKPTRTPSVRKYKDVEDALKDSDQEEFNQSSRNYIY